MITTEIEVALLPGLIAPPKDPRNSLAVVIDTLRFTTTAIQALTVGAQSVSVASDIETVQQLATNAASTKFPTRPLLCGERHCRPIAGFDLGNSPGEYIAERIGGRSLLFTTTNGTLAVAACHDFGTCLLAGLVNRTAVAQAIMAAGVPRCSIVCAGTDGQVALEDVLAAGAIVAALVELQAANVEVRLANDSARLALDAWQPIANAASKAPIELITGYFRQAAGGRNLVEQGYTADLDFAAQVDSISTIGRLDHELTRQFGCQTFTSPR